LKSDLSKAESEVVSSQSDLGKSKNEVASLQSDLGETETELTAAEGKIAELEAAAARAAISESQEIQIWTIENDAEGIPRTTREADVGYLDMGMLLGEGDGLLAILSSTGIINLEAPIVSCMIVTCEPGGTIATHTGPQTSICYILQGTGKLTLEGGEPLDYKPNYCIILGPDTLHGWENDNEVTAMLVVSVP